MIGMIMQYDKTDKTDEMFQELGCLLRHVGENPSASDVAVLVFIYHRRSLHLMIITKMWQEMAVEVDVGQTGFFIFPNFLEMMQRSKMTVRGTMVRSEV